MKDLFKGFKFMHTYIDGILILPKGDWPNHVYKLESTLNKLKEIGIKCNIKNSFFGQTEMECLHFWVTRYGTKNINKKKKSDKNIIPPISEKEVR